MGECAWGEGFAFYTSISSSYGNFNLFTYKQLACWSCTSLSCPLQHAFSLLSFADCDSGAQIQALHKHPSPDAILHFLVLDTARGFGWALGNWTPISLWANACLCPKVCVNKQGRSKPWLQQGEGAHRHPGHPNGDAAAQLTPDTSWERGSSDERHRNTAEGTEHPSYGCVRSQLHWVILA